MSSAREWGDTITGGKKMSDCYWNQFTSYTTKNKTHECVWQQHDLFTRTSFTKTTELLRYPEGGGGKTLRSVSNSVAIAARTTQHSNSVKSNQFQEIRTGHNHKGRRSGAVRSASGLRAGWMTDRRSITGKGKISSVLPTVQSSSEAHPATCSTSNVRPIFLGVNCPVSSN